jgi:glycosyltransferase involved in cell wall biosynthesis
VLHFSLSDLDGGAARAAYRTHLALLRAGADSRLVVRSRLSADSTVELVDPPRRWESRRRRLAAKLPLRPRLPEATATFNFDLPQAFDERSLFGPGDIDVVCFHRITRFLTVRQMRAIYERYGCALVWVLLDQQPVTGGCHYSLDCDRYRFSCGRCPQLLSEDPNDASHTIWERKRRLLADLPIVFVAPSGDTERWVRESSLFGGHRVERIPLPIDTDVFRPVERRAAREILGVPPGAKVVLLAAAALHASRKGTALGTEAVRRLVDLYEPETSERLFMLTAGEGSAETLAATGLPGRAVGLLADEVSLALVYQAADVFLSPSLADAGPMMVPEALLCGTPVVAFELGYARDLITDPAAGAVVPADNVEALAQGLRETLDRHGDQQACRQAALAFAADDVAAAYLELYGSLRVTGRG